MSLKTPAKLPNNDLVKQPYSVPSRKERSRELAQKRRTTYKSLMNDVADALPFSKEVVSQIDYNSRLRLALCYIKMKGLLGANNNKQDDDQSTTVRQQMSNCTGQLQDLIMESLDGFLLTCIEDGTIMHISDTIHKHLGLFQSEHIGSSIYDLIHEDDHAKVKKSISHAELQALSKLSNKGMVDCSFFCRMRCSKSKLSNSGTMSSGYKVVYASGQFKLSNSGSFFTAIVHPISPPSILEVRMEGNMFVTHYGLDMRCIFFDGRLNQLLGFAKDDLIGHVPFEHQHHDDVSANLECSKGLMERGEGISGYYRFINKYGCHIWMQSRGVMMFDSRTGQPSYIVCMNYVISKEKAEKELKNRPLPVMDTDRSFDPFPTTRDDNLLPNPFEDEPPMAARIPSSKLLVKIDAMPSSSSGHSSPVESLTPSLTPSDTYIQEVVDRDDMGYGSDVSNTTSLVSSHSVLGHDDMGSSSNSDSVYSGSPQSHLSPEPLHKATPTKHTQAGRNSSILASLLVKPPSGLALTTAQPAMSMTQHQNVITDNYRNHLSSSDTPSLVYSAQQDSSRQLYAPISDVTRPLYSTQPAPYMMGMGPQPVTHCDQPPTTNTYPTTHLEFSASFIPAPQSLPTQSYYNVGGAGGGGKHHLPVLSFEDVQILVPSHVVPPNY